MRASFTALALLATSASAHFSIITPASRGDSDKTQAESPCGGLKVSSTRTKYSISEGVPLSFDAGHAEAETAVYLAIGNDPVADDFTIELVKPFNQIGMGEFCWNSFKIPEGTEGIENGVNGTIQVVQRGHSGDGLYNVSFLGLWRYLELYLTSQ